MGRLTAALVCACAALSWQYLTVRANYGGSWTALFCTGSRFEIPPALAFEHIYVFPNSAGYDGQMYHYAAHDPLLRHGLAKYIDNPRLRYRRILIPALAFLIAGGQQRWIDTGYLAANLVFVFLGAWWLGRFNVQWAPLFVLVPAVWISLNRLTVDVALTALTIGFAVYAREGPDWKLYGVLALAGLSRETGLVLVAAYCCSQMLERRFGRAAVFATAAVPAASWYGYVASRTANLPYASWADLAPLRGFVYAAMHPLMVPGHAAGWLVAALNEASLVGCLVGFGISFRLLWRERKPAAAMWAAIAICLPAAFWIDSYCTRVLSPMLMLLALEGYAAPLWLTTPFVLAQSGPAVLGIAQHLVGRP